MMKVNFNKCNSTIFSKRHQNTFTNTENNRMKVKCEKDICEEKVLLEDSQIISLLSYSRKKQRDGMSARVRDVEDLMILKSSKSS